MPAASVLRQLVASLSNPLLGILLVAAGASAFLGERVNASIVVAMVVLSASIDFMQSYRSARAVERPGHRAPASRPHRR